ncbi:transcriptional regulator [Brevibacillus ruminantium]|uniref:Transcriptional regulator n=1 Tax=Brevibacillus ruminantium TaxID=2950604 RepID=A0ABY4W843_9BACL|nr:metalloregulator ArsR/SmtB family transcription factor [Brevibacillus ruminantium]USG63342.1 transcriptional regulator [Brevibacillus ruminantium]
MNKHAAIFWKHSTKREILLMLKKRGAVSARDMAEQLGISQFAVRRHLYALQNDHYIQADTHRQKFGRPSSAYHLTRRAENILPHTYGKLATELIEGMEDLFGDSFVTRLFERRMERMKSKYRQEMDGQNFDERLATLAALQNQEGFMVQFAKKHDGEYTFEEVNCPVLQVAKQYRLACDCERRLFASLLDADVERTRCIADGDEKCCYRIIKKQDE